MTPEDKERLLEELNKMWELFAHTVKPNDKDKIIQYLEAKSKIHGILANDQISSPDPIQFEVKPAIKGITPNGVWEVGTAYLAIEEGHAALLVALMNGQNVILWAGNVEENEGNDTPESNPIPTIGKVGIA